MPKKNISYPKIKDKLKEELSLNKLTVSEDLLNNVKMDQAKAAKEERENKSD